MPYKVSSTMTRLLKRASMTCNFTAGEPSDHHILRTLSKDLIWHILRLQSERLNQCLV